MTTILTVTKPYGPPWRDSSKNLARDLIRASSELQFRVMATPKYRDLQPWVKVEPVYQNPGHFAPGPMQNLRVLVRLLQDPKADILHFFSAPNPLSAKAARLVQHLPWRRRPTVQSLCSLPDDDDKIRAGVFADRVVVMSHQAQQRLAKLGRPDAICIPPSVRRPPLRRLDQRKLLRQRLGFDDGPQILFAGDVHPGGGAQDFVDAMPGIAEKLSAVRFIIASRAKNPASRAEHQRLRDQVNAQGLAPQTLFLGEHRAMRSLLSSVDVQVLTPRSLARKMDYPLVLLEGLARGLPMVVSAQPPLNELLDLEPGAGLAVSPSQPDALAAAVVSLLGDSTRWQRARQAAYALSSLLSPEAMAQAYAQLYAQLLP